ncbi:MAG TPA: glycosyltransferase family 4 protein, partial [Flavitalea sp.]|nr:glycosyltransferase family 4 protein [Flavitalea sp.]
HLHCFEYGRGVQPELNKYCTTVRYYKRVTGLRGFSPSLPYIVSSRRSISLIQNLLQDNYPILIEGIHCSYIVMDERFKHRKLILRLHNVEYNYYQGLARTTSSLIKRIYYSYESRMLFRYENRIAKKVMVLPVSEHDLQIYRDKFHADNILFLPVFLPYETVTSMEGTGSFCLYHGNLAVAENEKAVVWLIEKVFINLKTAFVIAGKNPSKLLRKVVAGNPDSFLVANPTENEMQDLISKAQINVLPSFNTTGIKLKLLNALFNGRHCVVNDASVMGTSILSECHIAKDADTFKSILSQLFHRPFTEEAVNQRTICLEGVYNNQKNARQLIQWIW